MLLRIPHSTDSGWFFDYHRQGRETLSYSKTGTEEKTVPVLANI